MARRRGVKAAQPIRKSAVQCNDHQIGEQGYCLISGAALSRFWTPRTLLRQAIVSDTTKCGPLLRTFGAKMETIVVLVTFGDLVLYEIANQSHDFCPDSRSLR